MRQLTRRLTVTLVPALVIGAASIAPSASSLTAAAATPAIAFEVPRVADPIHTYGEPNIGVAPNQAAYVSQPSDRTSGEVYVSGPTGTGTQRSIWQGSVDGGHTFRNIVRDNPVNPLPAPCQVVTGVQACGSIAAPGGGDTEINFDHNRKQYFADLYALACQQTATRTVDNTGHDTVAENSGIGPFGTLGGCPVPGSDRQWILVKDPAISYSPPPAPTVQAAAPIIYMESNTVGAVNCTPGSGAWYRSTDGLNYVSAEPGQLGGVAASYCPFGADGYPSIDQQTGKVFQAEYGSISGQPAIQLNIGTPINAAGDLCFLDHSLGTYGGLFPADGCANAANGPNPNKVITIATNNPALHDVVNNATEAANFVVTSMDSGRNLWVVWVNHASDPAQHQAWVSVAGASSGWTDWSTPVQVSKPPSRVSIFPWIQAGDAGRADVVWYGDSTSATPSDTAAHHVWDVYMSQVVYPVAPIITAGTALKRAVQLQAGVPLNTSSPPSVTQVKVTPHPMDLTDVCLLGTLCVTAFGNRNLADFFEVRTDNTGAAMIVYNDMSNGYCQPIFGGCPGNQQLDHAGSPVVTVARQSSGPGLFSNPISGAPLLVNGPSNAPVSGLADAAGDARSPLFGGANIPQLDVLDHRLSASGQTLTVTWKLAGDPNAAAAATTAEGCGALCHVQYVTRWQMGTHLYYGMVENGPTTGLAYYAGESKTIDDCSVSACDPHMLTYPESDVSGAPIPTATGHAEHGAVSCPPTPSAATPCTLTETINVADIGSPTASSLLEEVAGYAFVSQLPQALITQVQERLDSGATEVDGVCCYNFVSSGVTPPTPGTTPSPLPSTLPNTASSHAPISALWPAAGLALLALPAVAVLEDRRRRRRARG